MRLQDILLLVGVVFVGVIKMGLSLGFMVSTASVTWFASWLVMLIPFVGLPLSFFVSMGGRAVGFVLGYAVAVCLSLMTTAFVTTLFYITYGHAGRLKGKIEARLLQFLVLKIFGGILPLVNMIPWEGVAWWLTLRSVHRQYDADRAAEAQGGSETESPEPEEPEGKTEQDAERAPSINRDVRPNRPANDNVPAHAHAA